MTNASYDARALLAAEYEASTDAPAGSGFRFHAANVRVMHKRDYTDWKDKAALRALCKALTGEEEVRDEGWQSIETAPRDGTKFDAWVPDAFGGHRMCNLSFNWRGRLRQHGLLSGADLPRWPTHWRPLPQPPERGGE